VTIEGLGTVDQVKSGDLGQVAGDIPSERSRQAVHGGNIRYLAMHSASPAIAALSLWGFDESEIMDSRVQQVVAVALV
jgi:hypothetical protein